MQLTSHHFKARSREKLADVNLQGALKKLQGNFVKELPLPALGSVGGVGGNRYDSEFFYTFTSYLEPSLIFRYDVKSGQSTLFLRSQIQFDSVCRLFDRSFRCRWLRAAASGRDFPHLEAYAGDSGVWSLRREDSAGAAHQVGRHG